MGVEAARGERERKFVVGAFARLAVRARQKAGPAIGRGKAAAQIAAFGPRMRHIGAGPLQVLLAAEALGRDAGHVAFAAGRRASEFVPDLVAGGKFETR